MKSKIFIINLLFLNLGVTSSYAQEVERTFTLAFKNGQLLTVNADNSLQIAPMRSGEDAASQWFTIVTLANHRAKISSGLVPGLFLKRNASSVELAADTGGDEFTWEVIYAGYPYASLSVPGAHQVLSGPPGNAPVIYAVTTPLTGNDDPSGDDYRLSIRSVDELSANTRQEGPELAAEVEREGYRMELSYPNPFSEFTHIGYVLPEASSVQVSVIDVTGKLVKALVGDHQAGGSYRLQWYRDNNRGEQVPPGTYFIQMMAGKESFSQMVIVK